MAISVLLHGYDSQGAELWHREPRGWDDRRIRQRLRDRLEPADPEPAWSCRISLDEARALTAELGPAALPWQAAANAALDDLLQAPTTEVEVLLFEWGSE